MPWFRVWCIIICGLVCQNREERKHMKLLVDGREIEA